MKTIVIRHKETGEIKTFKRVYDTRCLVNCITGEESYLVLCFAASEELKLDLNLWDVIIESGEPEDFPNPDLRFPLYEQFDILWRLAYSLKQCDLSSLAELLEYDPVQLPSDIDFFLDYADIPITSDYLPF